jgi:hypothetical protein
MARGEDLQVEVDDVPAGDHVGVARAQALAQHRQERSLGRDAGDGRRGHRWPDEEHLPWTARASEGHRGDRASPVGLDVEGEPRQRRHGVGGGELRVHEDQVDAAARDRLAAEGDRPGQPEREQRVRRPGVLDVPRGRAARGQPPPGVLGRTPRQVDAGEGGAGEVGPAGEVEGGAVGVGEQGGGAGAVLGGHVHGGRRRGQHQGEAAPVLEPPSGQDAPGRGRVRPVLVPGRDDEAAHLGHPGALTRPQESTPGRQRGVLAGSGRPRCLGQLNSSPTLDADRPPLPQRFSSRSHRKT